MIIASLTNKNHTLVLNELLSLDSRVQASALAGLQRGMRLAASITQRDFLSGPRPEILDRVTGNLRRSIAPVVQIDGRTVTGFLGSSMPYAAYHEFGFHGTIEVRGYERRISRLASRGGSFAGRDATQRAATVFVPAHRRRVDYDGRPFVGPGLEKALPLIIAEIEKEL
jgi:phage gpG-like protein